MSGAGPDAVRVNRLIDGKQRAMKHMNKTYRLAAVLIAASGMVATTGVAAQAAPSAIVATATPPTPVPAAGTGPQEIIAPGTKGSDIWIAWSGVQPYLMGRYSWSYMWYMKANATNHQAFVSAACAFIPAGPFSTLAKSACVVAVNIYYNYMKELVNVGLAHKTCFQYRVPITSPSSTALISSRTVFTLVRCAR